LTVSDDQYRLFYAAAEGEVRLMKSLHLKGWVINSYDYDGRSALGLAASEGNNEAVNYLIDHGANLNHRDARGNTPLEDAIRENKAETVEILKKALE